MINNAFVQAPESCFYPLPHMYPHIRISPFNPREWEKILGLPVKNFSQEVTTPDFWLNEARSCEFFASGRDALLMCLRDLRVRSQDEVMIVKNTDGPYISRCVTETIEKVGRWSQTLSPQTKVVLVIHEFGFPCPLEKILPYKKKGLPIVEDAVYALGSRMEGAQVGILGNYAFYSLPKYFPVPFGGVLASREKFKALDTAAPISPSFKKLILEMLLSSYPFLKAWNKSRRNNWLFFSQRLSANGLKPYFLLAHNIVPGVYLAKVPKNFNGEEVKKHLNAFGVESTQYYRQNGFYFPVHQFLTGYEREYILHHFMRKIHK